MQTMLGVIGGSGVYQIDGLGGASWVKVKTPWNPELVNTLHQIKLTKIDEDGLVRFEYVGEPALT